MMKISGNTTVVNYIKEVAGIEDGKVTELNLEHATTYYAIEGNLPTDTTTFNHYKISSINKTLDVTTNNINIYTVKPIITTKAYVENMLETERYTAGKEILFEVTTSESTKMLIHKSTKKLQTYIII